ncbi:MAG TPA: AtpZ/AtpI family protein [Sphingomicrobium sp.]|jgi:ATP synthase protein I|nr:AtpZ/AtpI family protein [Sphingomicrobium sp.]
MTTDETGQDNSRLPPDARIDSLEKRIERAQQVEAERTYKPQPDPTGRIAQQLFGHLIGAPAGGGLIGWGLDSLFGTFPLWFLIMLFVGFGVGVRNVMRISRTPPGNGSGESS